MERKAPIPDVMKSAAAVMAADVMLLLGFVFMLLGVAKFLNEFLGVPGIGEGSVGLVLLIVGIMVIARSRLNVRFARVPQQPQMPVPPVKEAPTDSYR